MILLKRALVLVPLLSFFLTSHAWPTDLSGLKFCLDPGHGAYPTIKPFETIINLKVGFYLKDYLESADQVCTYLIHHLKNRNRELFLLILLNGRNQIIDLITLFEGSLTTSAVYPREVIKLILERDAAAVIFVHNHPSGNLSPSQDDHRITKRLKQACQSIDVQVHDHIIIGGNEHFSFADHGLL